MYNELYEVWKQEFENAELAKLPPDFYSRVADYLRRLREEGRMLDKRTAKAGLLKKELQNVKRIVRELFLSRYRKIAGKMAKGEKVGSGILTVEEERICAGISPFSEAFQSLVKDVLQGHVPRTDAKQESNRTVLRFLKDIPAIIGSDMKTYGPFKIEDIASLPVENARILVKQGLAEEVEIV
jgi:DNA replication factor GINS